MSENIKEIQRRIKITAMYGYAVGVDNERHSKHNPSISDEEALEHAESINALYQSQLTQSNEKLSAAQQEIERLRALVKSPKGPKCECGSIDVETHGGGFQEAKASRGLPEMDGYQMGCNSCGLVWHE